MAKAQETERHVVAEIDSDHQLVQQLLEKVEAHLSAFPEKKPSAWGADLGQILGTLRDRLTSHFDVEERAGFFTSFVEEFPRFAKQVSEFHHQHETLLGEVDEIERRLDAARGAELEEARQATRHLLRMIRKHEHDETEVLQQAYYNDVGVGD